MLTAWFLPQGTMPLPKVQAKQRAKSEARRFHRALSNHGNNILDTPDVSAYIGAMEHALAGPQTLLQAVQYFADKDRALAFMVALRWPDGVSCPYCLTKEPSFLSTRHIWKCKAPNCRKQFSIKVGTIFEDSPLGLEKWLPALWMIANDKNGISSYELHRALGVTQKTAWFMLHRIRAAMQTKTFGKFGGDVEADETFIGGRSRFMHKDKRARVPGKRLTYKALIGSELPQTC